MSLDLTKVIGVRPSGNTNWLQSAQQVRINLTTQPDGSCKAEALNGRFVKLAADSTDAIRELRSDLWDAARKGEF